MIRHAGISSNLLARVITLALCCICLDGYAFGPFHMDVFENKSLESWDEGELLSLDEVSALMKTWSKNSSAISDFTLSSSQTVRIGYAWKLGFRYMPIILAKINGGKSYYLCIDSGSPFSLCLTDAHITENDLPFMPQTSTSGKWGPRGVSRIDQISLGEMTLKDVHAIYEEKDWGLNLFGLPLFRAKAINLGLLSLIRFRYVLFDGIQREVEFSPSESFTIENTGDWEVWPIITGPSGWPRIFVKIPVAGKEMILGFDTGMPPGITLTENEWRHLSQRTQPVQLRRSKDFWPYCGGWVPINKGKIKDLMIGNRRINSLRIRVFPENTKIPLNGQGLLGMEAFKDTIMVLDFEHMQMWVKKTPEEGLVSKD